MAETIQADLKIKNRKGLHARASYKFVRCAEQFDATVMVTRGDYTVDATSIMSLMMLGASIGTTIRLDATGPQANAAVVALSALIDDLFGEGE